MNTCLVTCKCNWVRSCVNVWFCIKKMCTIFWPKVFKYLFICEFSWYVYTDGCNWCWWKIGALSSLHINYAWNCAQNCTRILSRVDGPWKGYWSPFVQSFESLADNSVPHYCLTLFFPTSSSSSDSLAVSGHRRRRRSLFLRRPRRSSCGSYAQWSKVDVETDNSIRPQKNDENKIA